MLTAGQLDAIQADLALRFGTTVGRRVVAGVDAVVDEVAEWTRHNPERDARWTAARYASELVRRAPYASNNVGVALMAAYIVMRRAGRKWVADAGEVYVLMNEVFKGRMARPTLATWLQSATTEDA